MFNVSRPAGLSRFFIGSIVLTLSLTSAGLQRQKSYDPLTSSACDTKLTFNLLRPGYGLALAPGEGGMYGDPIEAFENLYLTTPSGTRKRIKRLEELRGAVQIESPADAVAFVRLRTDYSTTYLFSDPGFEVTTKKHIALHLGIGRNGYPRPDILGHVDQGYEGAVTAQGLSAIADSYPRVTSLQDSWSVERLVVVRSSPAYVAHVAETVWRDGGYVVHSGRPIRTGPFSKVEWRSFTFE